MKRSSPSAPRQGRRKRSARSVVIEPTLPFPRQHQRSPGLESRLDPPPHWQAPRYVPAGKLAGKVALVTGGDSGIGRAVAFLYTREGADVAIPFLKEERSDAIWAGEQAPLSRRCRQKRGTPLEHANRRRSLTVNRRRPYNTSRILEKAQPVDQFLTVMLLSTDSTPRTLFASFVTRSFSASDLASPLMTT